jgi:2-methylisocitrate lyase-like PEP mutase family enzyme
MRAAEETLTNLLQNGTQTDSIERMMTRAELYDRLNYTNYEARDRVYFEPKKPESGD